MLPSEGSFAKKPGTGTGPSTDIIVPTARAWPARAGAGGYICSAGMRRCCVSGASTQTTGVLPPPEAWCSSPWQDRQGRQRRSPRCVHVGVRVSCASVTRRMRPHSLIQSTTCSRGRAPQGGRQAPRGGRHQRELVLCCVNLLQERYAACRSSKANVFAHPFFDPFPPHLLAATSSTSAAAAATSTRGAILKL